LKGFNVCFLCEVSRQKLYPFSFDLCKRRTRFSALMILALVVVLCGGGEIKNVVAIIAVLARIHSVRALCRHFVITCHENLRKRVLICNNRSQVFRCGF